MTLASRAVIGVDAGTTSAKAVVVDRTGATLGSGASAPIATDVSQPGGSEQDAADISLAVGEAIRRAIGACAGEVDVEAVAIAAQSGSVVPIGPDGRRGPVVTWMDTRAQPIVDRWSAATNGTIRSVSGWSATAGSGLATISRLRQRSAAGTVARWASVDDHLVEQLCGRWVTNPSNAAGMQLMAVSGRQWSPELCSIAGVAPQALSRVEESGYDLGSVGRRGAAFGLDEHVKLVVGGHDQACAALGLGALEPGDVVLSAGTAWVMSVITPTVGVDALPAGFNLSPHIAAERWSASKNLGPLGAVIASCLGSLGSTDVEATLGSNARGEDDPHFVLNTTDPDRGSWGHVVSDKPTDPIGRAGAAFEACAFEVRSAIAAAPTPAGDSRAITLVGGGTRSPYLCRLIADATSRHVLVFPDASWPGLGAARIATAALGWPGRASLPVVPTVVTPRPDPDGVGERRYLIHRQLNAGERP